MVATTSSPVHPSSLVDPATHSTVLLELLDLGISREFIEYVVDCVVETVDYAMGRPSSSRRGRSPSRNTEHAKFTAFVTDVIQKAEVKLASLLVTLVYIDRAKPHIQIALEQWACERVFLGALIVANKYVNDSTLKNVHWALCTGVFGKRDIGRIEREFLDVLDFELGVQESDILSHHAVIMSLTRPLRRSHVKFRPTSRTPRAVHPRAHSPAPVSRWSSDSSTDLDMDSDSSFESLSPPHTPMEVDTAYLPALPKYAVDEHSHTGAPQIVLPPAPSHPHPTKVHADAVYTRPLPQAPQSQLQQQTQVQQTQARSPAPSRFDSALQLLHSFPLPQLSSASRQSSAQGCRSSRRTRAAPPAPRAQHVYA
ncbi:hypothetical protein CERSUDRAFT_113418 [Gelatoporia subvermispora B]|uniref:Cyclin N-terminal domain-containing protein n=1 Tax=Ceriporiopsis subvermispora (strain B) TaxID=914234 RepID=M2R160_CERS8|nr:hypothetical protein CERSUDRAFT_113418 [Gelatoporia subvermispora B]